MVIQHNLSSMYTQRQLGVTTDIKKKSTEKLSSGYRINRAADDAAGLAISEKMRRLIRGMGQNLDNIQDGISFCQVADGYLHEVHDMMQRINELGVHAANETLSDEDRNYTNMEVQQIKDEMQRIFDGATFNEMPIFRVPYTPSVIPHNEPYDMQIFYSENGKLGGLEFNNVRYNLSELRSKGMNLDSNGIANSDIDVEFTLYDGEYVHLQLNSGYALNSVHRVYDWTADDTGIYVNRKPAATWSSLGIRGDGHDNGLYSFDFHGMSIGFSVSDGDKLSHIISGINGDAITESAFWDTAVSSTTTRSIISYKSDSTLSANNANASYFEHEFQLSANEAGLAVVDATNGSGSSARTPWSEFRNVGPSLPSDETGSGYPIVDWGIDNDGNDASQITFDTDALYRYRGKNTNLPVEFTFSLADVASQPQVIEAANATAFSGSITCPATLTYNAGLGNTSTSDGSYINIYNTRITANNESAFVLQRAYGRNFDTNAALSGNISWTKKEVANSETGHLLPLTANTYPTSITQTTTSPEAFYYHDTVNDVYYKFDETKTTTVEDLRTDEVYKWSKQFDITYDGSLGNVDMMDSTERVTVGYTENRTTAYTRTVQIYNYTNETVLTDEEVADFLAGGGSFAEQFKANPDAVNSPGTVSSNISVDDGVLSHGQNFTSEDGSSGTAFTFLHRISHSMIDSSAGGSSNLNLTFNGDAKRVFTPVSHSSTIGEHDFNKITVHAPKKSMVIQASPDSPIEEQIELEWSGLNLNIVGMAGTNTLSASAARTAIDEAKEGIRFIAEERGIFGAMQNRCEHAYKNVANTRENTQASESIIRDTDMASEYMKLSNHNILEQAGQAMLAQANQSNNGVLNLLQ